MSTPDQPQAPAPHTAVLQRIVEEVKADALTVIKADERYAPVVARIAADFFSAFGF